MMAQARKTRIAVPQISDSRAHHNDSQGINRDTLVTRFRKIAPLSSVAGERTIPLPARTCPRCDSSLVEIDCYGDRLVGCLDCNRWGRPDEDDDLPMQMEGDDIFAVRGRVRPN